MMPTDPVDVPADSVADEAVQVEAAESELRRLGLEAIRVRHHGDLARLEAPHGDLASMASEPLRGEVLRAVRSAGFRSVAVDLDAVTERRDS
jgi:PP-loop superfamily ATP-utilizing enzyme